jgi:hypothetical protein
VPPFASTKEGALRREDPVGLLARKAVFEVLRDAEEEGGEGAEENPDAVDTGKGMGELVASFPVEDAPTELRDGSTDAVFPFQPLSESVTGEGLIPRTDKEAPAVTTKGDRVRRTRRNSARTFRWIR